MTCFCRQNAFQVIAVDGVCSGVIQCPTAEECLEWLQAVATNISTLTKHNVSIKMPLFIQCLKWWEKKLKKQTIITQAFKGVYFINVDTLYLSLFLGF